ncbi:MAG: T9SS type A sorting domain-containing protein [Flavobacteriales bacterium]|nr:T9SS type A sorting domain-containing protein [Flavobacteriales bacterium]
MIRIKPFFIVFTIGLLCSQAWAATYTKSSSGNYTSAAGWSPSYPGTTISSGDVVIINAAVTMNADLTVEGTLTINSGASLTGTKEIKEIKTGGTLTNNGTISIKKIDKVEGTLTLNGPTTVTDDLKVEDGTMTIGSSGSFTGKKLEVEDHGSLVISGSITLSDELKVKDDGGVTFNFGASGNIEKIKVEDDASFTNSGTITINEDLEVKDDASFTNNAGGYIVVKNDLKVKDDSFFTNTGTITVEDDIELEDDATVSLNGVLNLCDDTGTEGENKFEVDNGVNLSGTGTACICSSNNNNYYDNNSNNQGAITYNQNCNGPLPIELINFRVERKDAFVMVRWATLSEINNARFEIQVSKDGREFSSVGEVPGAGTSNEQIEYEFEDFQPDASISLYYRLKNVDFDGRKGYSDLQIIKPNDENADTKNNPFIYPTVLNAGQKLTFEHVSAEVNTIELISLSGQVWTLKLLGEQCQIPTGIQAGVYVVFVKDVANTFSQKIIIE